jgi:GNAT superfamily N-acetyltransferase
VPGYRARSRDGVLGDPEIRPAIAVDAAILTSLAFRSKAHWGYSIEFMAACKDELTYSTALIEAPQFHFYVCEIDNQIVGFYALEVLDAISAELNALFVLPRLIGNGIGKALIAHCRTVATRLGVQTMIIQGDPNAEAFYLAVGALACGYRESLSISGRQLPVFRITL